MRWRGQRESDQIEDRRGLPVRRGGLALGGGGLVLLLVVAVLTGRDPLQLIEVVSGPPQVSVDPGTAGQRGAPADEAGKFASVVLASTEDVWRRHFTEGGRDYQLPTLVLFSDAVESACGFNSAAVGPFYCPPDRKVYLDLSFFAELDRRFGAPGDFAQAYVIAHEVGHHVQNLLGIAGKVHAARERLSQEEANALSVRMELQADCLAGVWAHDAQRDANLLERGDVEEGMAAAAAIGDDRLQRRAQGYTVPESWTHGSSEMRVRWLRRGLDAGDPDACDTFADGARSG
jgi:predicted metalloprotease